MHYFIQIQALPNKNNFWGISHDAWFTGLTPILIFILGYIINEIIKNNNEKKRLEELERYFKKLIELLEKPLNRQKEEFLKFSQSLKDKKEQFLNLNQVANFHIEQIREINNKDLYTIFIKNKKGSINDKTELYGKLKGNLDLVEEIRKSFESDFTIFWTKYDKYQQEYKMNIETISVIFESMVSKHEAYSQQQDDLLLGIAKIRSSWFELKFSNIEYKDMYIAQQMFVEPVRELCRQYYYNPRSALILRYIKQCTGAFNNILETKKVFRRSFLLKAWNLRKSWIEINDVIKKFESLKKKHLIFPRIIKIILSAVFIICLFPMTYGYYEAARFIGMLGFALLAYFDYQKSQMINSGVIIYIALALLFQPFIKVALGRTIWNVVDVIVSLGLLISIFIKPKEV